MWQPNVHYRVHNSLLFVSILSQVIQLTPHSIFRRSTYLPHAPLLILFYFMSPIRIRLLVFPENDVSAVQNSCNPKTFRVGFRAEGHDKGDYRYVVASRTNRLQPTGHVMHQQFNVQQLYVLPTLYLCVLYLSENKQRLVPLTA